MKLVLNISLIVVVVFLILTILLQQKGSGLGSAFGGDGGVYTTRRGAEKFVFTTSIILSILFLILSFLSFYLQ